MSAVVVDPGGFVLTPALIKHVTTGSITGASLALALALLVCCTSAWVYSVPSARHHLDRVSFRLLLWSMAVEVLYTASFIVLTRDAQLVHNRSACGAMVYILLSTMGVCNWLCTCIGLNLMLAITFGVNPIQYRLERWYLLGSFVLGFGIPLAPAILGHFGRDPRYAACYFTQGDKTLRIRDFVLDLYVWQLLSCLIAAVSVSTVLVSLFRRSRATERVLLRGNTLAVTSTELREITSSLTPLDAASPSHNLQSHSQPDWYARLRHRDCRTTKRSHMHRLQDKLATIALKISLYPLALLLINVIITAEDLAYTSRGGLFSTGQYAMYWLHNFLYGGRGIFFALLGIFVDPCLRLGVPAAWRARTRRWPRAKPQQGQEEEGEAYDDAQSINNFLTSTGPEVEYGTSSGMGTAGRGSIARWFGLGVEEEKERNVEMMGDEKEVEAEKVSEGGLVVDLGQGRKSLAVERAGEGSDQQFSLSTDHTPSQPLPLRLQPSTFRPSDPSSPSVRSPRHDPEAWIQPLASAILTRAPSAVSRRNSDPAMGVAQRRKRELQAAAEELYAQAQMRL